MPLTLELPRQTEEFLQSEAARHGQKLADYATDLLREAAEDAEDVADAERVMAESDPSQWRTLDELRVAVRGKNGRRGTG